jgi:hypothetical protein
LVESVSYDAAVIIYPWPHCSWPAFLYKDEQYDSQNPTNGLFKGHLLVKVRVAVSVVFRDIA